MVRDAVRCDVLGLFYGGMAGGLLVLGEGS